jgi:hypothetical protein
MSKERDIETVIVAKLQDAAHIMFVCFEMCPRDIEDRISSVMGDLNDLIGEIDE